MNQSTIAIIGAGIAGLSCARPLSAAGWKVRLFDKGPAPGGRMATRRVTLADGREISFDHGAQYVTARDPDFAALCEGLERGGSAGLFPWPVFSQTRRGADAPDASPRYVGTPGMNAIPMAMARTLAVTSGRAVIGLSRSVAGWRLSFADGSSEGGFVAVVVAVPAEQAVHLVAGLRDAFAEEAASARTAPCWAALFAFEGGGEPAFGAIRLEDDGPLCWLARTGDGQGWIAHATAAWSRLNLEMSPEAVAAGLEAAARRVLPEVGRTQLAQTHRWRFALVEAPAASAYAWDEDLKLGLCGDWRLGPRVELAWRSGDALGRAIVAGADAPPVQARLQAGSAA